MIFFVIKAQKTINELAGVVGLTVASVNIKTMARAVTDIGHLAFIGGKFIAALGGRIIGAAYGLFRWGLRVAVFGMFVGVVGRIIEVTVPQLVSETDPA